MGLIDEMTEEADPISELEAVEPEVVEPEETPVQEAAVSETEKMQAEPVTAPEVTPAEVEMAPVSGDTDTAIQVSAEEIEEAIEQLRETFGDK